MRIDFSCRRLLAAARATAAMLATALVGPAFAADAAPAPAAAASSASADKTYAVVSLIGDRFSVVTRRAEAGTRLDPNMRREFPVPDAVFDRIASAAVERALLARQPGAPVLRAAIRDPRLFALQERLLTESSESHDMRIALHDVLVKAGATELLLVTKRRGEASLGIVNGALTVGGTLDGIGFYLDDETHMYNTKHLMTGEGFLSPFAYVMVSRIDLASMTVRSSKQGLESSMSLPVDKEGAARAWDALSGQEKVDALDHVIRRAVGEATAGLLAE